MIDPLFQTAIQLHRAGRLAEAENHYRQILAQDPAHAGSLHHLGIIALQSGQAETAIELMSRSIAIDPRSPDAQSNLGNALKASGRCDDAINAFRQAIQLNPTLPEVRYNLATTFLDAGRFEEAIDAFRHAISLQSNYPEAHNNLGNALKAVGELDLAIAAYRYAITLKPRYFRAINNLGVALHLKGHFDEAIAALNHATEIAPTFPEARNNLGSAFRDSQRPDEAILAFQQAIALKPDFAEAHLNLANMLSANARAEEAIASYRTAIAINPTLPDAHNNLANLLRDRGQFDDAITLYAAGVSLHPQNPVAHFNLGSALSHQQRYADAILSFRRALGLQPDDVHIHEALGATLLLTSDFAAAESSLRQAVALAPETASLWNALGVALNCLGKFEEAAACFRRALDINPDVRFFRGLAASGHFDGDSVEVARLSALVDNPELPDDDRITAGFVLGKMLDDADRFDEAFARFAGANQLFRESRATMGARFDSSALRRDVDEKIVTFTADFFSTRRSWGNPSKIPVFIVGMPRSGTSLVEQIVASHPDVFGAGELQFIPHLPLINTPPAQWTAADIYAASGSYLDHIRSLAGPAPQYITDKMPQNIFHLGLIAAMFPNARVILCRRDPRDNCLSCYFQQFDNLLFSFDLADCARQFIETDRIAAHWLKTLPLSLIEIQYESLVTKQEAESRRLIDFLNLPWNPACLEFHRTRRPVMTASLWQVRQPIYSRSVNRWKHYERHLTPLLDILGNKTSPTPASFGSNFRQ